MHVYVNVKALPYKGRNGVFFIFQRRLIHIKQLHKNHFLCFVSI